MAGQTLGIIDYVWRGITVDAEKGSKLKLGGYKQNVVIANRKTKRAQEYEASEISATFALDRGVDPNVFWAPGEGELQCNCDTGQSFIFADAFLTNRPNMTGGEGGKMEATWAAGIPETLLNG